MKKISILIPVHNEEIALPAIYRELNKILINLNNYSWQILFVNDGSKDNTLNLIKQLKQKDDRVSYISLSRNFGKEAAMLAGFDFVESDATIIIDADMQDPPSLIPQMILCWEDGFEDVYARRISRGKESWLRKKMSILYYDILQKATNIEILKNVGDFRLLDRKCVNALKTMRENERYTKGMFCWIGFKKKELLFNRGDRTEGKSSWKFSSLFNLAIEGITSFTIAPLRLSTILGFVISLSAFIYMLYFLIKTIIYGDIVQGFPTLIIIILFLGGTQLLSLGIIGEYLGRIFNESKNRPTYIIDEYEK